MPAVAAEEERWRRTPQDAVEAQGQEAPRWSGSGQNKADGVEEAPPTWFRELFCQQLLSTKKGRGKSQHRGSRQDEMELLKYWEVAQLNKELRQQVTHLLEQHGHHLSLMQAQARAWQFASQRAVRALPFWFLARRMQQLPGSSHRRKSCVLSRRFLSLVADLPASGGEAGSGAADPESGEAGWDCVNPCNPGLFLIRFV